MDRLRRSTTQRRHSRDIQQRKYQGRQVSKTTCLILGNLLCILVSETPLALRLILVQKDYLVAFNQAVQCEHIRSVFLPLDAALYLTNRRR